MEAKNTFAFLGILAILVLALNFASAAISFTGTIAHPSTIFQGTPSYNFNFTLSNVNLTANITDLVISGTTNLGNVIINSYSPIIVNGSSSALITGTVNIPTTQKSGTITTTINASSALFNESIILPPFDVIIDPACTGGMKQNLSIDGSIDFSSTGDDDYDWKPLDAITITFDVKNKGDDSISSVYAKVIVLDKNGADKTSDFNFDKEKVSLGTIKDGDSKTATFTIPSVPADIDEDVSPYTLYFKAYKGTDEQCDDNAAAPTSEKQITFTKEERAVVLKDSDINTINLACGQTNMDLSLDVYNVGSKREDNVLVEVTIPELKITQFQTLPSSLGVDKMQNLLFNLNLPSLNKTAYDMRVLIYYNYNKDDKGDTESISSYDDNSLDDLDKSFIFPVKMPTSCIVTASTRPTITIPANQLSEVSVGKEMKISGSITNNGASAGDFAISPSGYESWAELVSITPTTNIAAGTTSNFTITLKPTKEGTQTFVIRAITNGQITEQQVQVTVSGSGNFLDSIKNQFGNVGDNAVYIMVAVLVILIILIIIVIAKVAGSGKRKKARRSSDDDDEDED